jgi:pyruvate ferredoxin oxidoreductase delta subunit
MSNKTWKELPAGGKIIEPGNSEDYKTGEWRAFRPVIDAARCIHCLQCWVFCPDSSILVENEKMAGFDLVHCKGCGICAAVCPVTCIDMKEEGSLKK